MDKQTFEAIDLYALCVNDNGFDKYLYKTNKRGSDQACIFKDFDEAMREYSFIKLNLYTLDINSKAYKMLSTVQVIKIKTEFLKMIKGW